MPIRHFILTGLALMFLALPVKAQEVVVSAKAPACDKVEKRFMFRVQLKDKKNNPYSLKKPQEFLSQKAIDRRKRYKLKVDRYDLPISPAYINELTGLGLSVHNKSKWNNTVVVNTTDTTLMEKVRQLPFVQSVRLVWIGPDSVVQTKSIDRKSLVSSTFKPLKHYYGHSRKQIEMLGVDRLHDAGYKGEGMTIAVLDGGFYNVDVIPFFDHSKILGTRNFVQPEVNVYDEPNHGMMVLSCIAGKAPNGIIGTAPEAFFYLLQTEDGRSEQLVEEDNYCAALEYADSLGCDIVTASLGYYKFDHDFMNHSYADLNGKTAVNSRADSLAASRGILLLNSAGNEGDNTWKKIGFPADAKDILTVGAVYADSTNTEFSSLGYTADGRIKPDAMAVGASSAVFTNAGTPGRANGTSFSCPILCGAVACLWQAHRDKSPKQIIEMVHQVGSFYNAPNEVYGYGIPNLWKAHQDFQYKK